MSAETKKVKKEKVAKPKKDRKDLTGLMNVLMVVGSVIICAGLTTLGMWMEYGDWIQKINATFTAILFTDIVAFAFLGALIMFGIRKLVLRK